jgi:hypothetical protein
MKHERRTEQIWKNKSGGKEQRRQGFIGRRARAVADPNPTFQPQQQVGRRE